MYHKLEKIVTSDKFERTIIAIIIINAIALGIETFNLSGVPGVVVIVINKICLYIFILELIIKLIVYKGKYFKSGWNLFDFSIIVLSLLPNVSFLSSARVLRVFRVFRVFRVTRIISSVKSLRRIVQALIDSLPSVGWTFLLLSIITYVFAIMGTDLFSDVSPDYFGDLWQSLYTLFQLMMADDIGNITRPIIEENSLSFIYFISFTLLATMLILNVLIGIMVDSIEEVKKLGKDKDEAEQSEEGKLDLAIEVEKLREQIDVISRLIDKDKTD